MQILLSGYFIKQDNDIVAFQNIHLDFILILITNESLLALV